MVTLNWLDGLAFEASTPSGHKLVVDSNDPDHGGKGRGPGPLETLLVGIAACTAMDVAAILEKKRQKVEAYRVEIEGDRVPEGEYPRPYTEIRVKHIVTGPHVDPAAVARAVELSDQKYCSAIATLRRSPTIVNTWAVERTSAAPTG